MSALVPDRMRAAPHAALATGVLAEIDPDTAQNHANMGVTLYYLGRFDEAVQSFEHALSKDPSLDMARAGLERARSVTRQDTP